MIETVFKFNREVVGVSGRALKPLDISEKAWLITALQEEIGELHHAKSLVDEVDAVLDLIIFAIGGLARMGLTETQAEGCFKAIMLSNFAKKAGQKETRKVEGVPDAIKPAEWVGPETKMEQLLR